MAKTVLDLIPLQEIAQWKQGDHVLICAGTGKCKTTWVTQVLWPFCRERGLSLFMLANRRMLRDDIRHGSDVPVLTYQMLEMEEHDGHPAWNADVVVLDECHSLATDIMLDPRRNKMLRLFRNGHTIVIGLTATPVECVTRLFDQARTYEIERDFPQISEIYTYGHIDLTKTILKEEIHRVGRVLCFIRSSRRGRALQQELPNTLFVCSRDAREWTPEIEEHKRSISQNHHWGDAQALISTKVMDVGVSIIDPAVTAVIVEPYDLRVDIVQMLGRIRCCQGQRIRLYIGIPSKKYIAQSDGVFREAIRRVSLYHSEPERYAYAEMYPFILSNGIPNEMAVGYARQRTHDFDEMTVYGSSAIIQSIFAGIPLRPYTGVSSVPVTSASTQDLAVLGESIVQKVLGREYLDKGELFKEFKLLVQLALSSAIFC